MTDRNVVTSADLVAEASEHASRIYECAMRSEDAGFDVRHVTTDPDTGVLLEAHGTSAQTLTDDAVIMQIADGTVSVETPVRSIETDSVQAACETILTDLKPDD